MKKLLAAALLSFLFTSVSAQSDSTYFELGLNAIRLTNFGLVDKTLDNEVWNPYMFTANYGMKRFNLRFGAGYSSIYRTELPTEANGQTTSDTSAKVIDTRIGVAWELGLSAKWTCKVGLDYIISNRFRSFEAKFKDFDGNLVENVREITYSEKGIAPFVFVQYNLSGRVSLGTELMYRLSGYKQTDRDKSNLNSAQITREYSGVKRILMAPTALFIQVRF